MSSSVLSKADTTANLFKKGDRIPSASCYLWTIRSGIVRTLTWTDEGDVMPLGFWGAGNVVGAFISQVAPYEIECLTEVEVAPFNPMKPLPNTTLLNHVSQASQFMQLLHCHRMDCRLEQFIAWFAGQFGQQHPDGVHLPVCLTHQQLAEAIGTTRVTVTRVMGQLEKCGKITWSRKQQIVHPQLLENCQRTAF